MLFKTNATLTFKIAQPGAVTRNPVTGVPIQPMMELYVEASLEAVRDANPSQGVLAGVDESALYLEGRAVNPKHLTDAMRVHKVVDMVLDRGRNARLTGKFYLLPTSSSRLGLESFWGDAIAGYFQVGA